MTRLANPAAVARFADDNVAKFPGNEGPVKICLCEMTVKNSSDTPQSLETVFVEGYCITDGVPSSPNELTVPANSEIKIYFIVEPDALPLKFCGIALNYPYLSEEVNCTTTSDEDGIYVNVTDSSENASITLDVGAII